MISHWPLLVLTISPRQARVPTEPRAATAESPAVVRFNVVHESETEILVPL